MFDVFEKAIEKSRNQGASYVEARGESGFIEYIQMDDSRINALTQRIERGVAIRELVDGAWGFVTNGDIDNLDKAVSDAISMAKAAAPSRREPIELADVKTYEDVIKANPVR
ncbi:MAG: TldD/PmbA family protein, partial [Candidatus Thorarchaeota archaeon]